MLVLSRFRDEEVVLRTADGQEIVVTVVAILRDKVRLGFDAHESVSVNRREIQEIIDREARQNA